jgi:hypothetical protein
MGVAQEPRRSCRLRTSNPGWGPGQPTTRLSAVASYRAESEAKDARAVAPNEGNKARRDGRQEVGAAYRYLRSRGTAPAGPCGGKELPNCGIYRGIDVRDIELGERLNATP